MNHLSQLKIAAVLLTVLFAFATFSCSTGKNATGDDLSDIGSLKMEKSGAILWGENCGRCHNAPDPAAFSDQQWEAIGTHMRIRAGLTAKDARKIIEFLKQSN